MNEFTPGRSQDASATIRGFVYQVELTILRWLGLHPAQVLQLERGEDIDQITRAAGGDDTGSRRLLEQVKDVQRSLTLHAPGAVTAIASFRAHRRSNPGRDLWFRYTTTASVGREKLSPLPVGFTGIEAWEQLRRGEVDQGTEVSLLTGIRTLLRTAKRPRDCSDALWTEYRWFSDATDDEILETIGRFEWSFGTLGVTALARDVVQAIQVRGSVALGTAELLHDILVASVFRTISQAGVKELTVVGLEAHLASPKMTESDRILLLSLRERVFGHALRLFALENRVEVLEIEQRALRAIIGDGGVGAEIAPLMPVPALAEPPLVRLLVNRTETVRKLKHEAGAATWIAISGSAGTGKSHLAGLLAGALGTHIRWFALRGIETKTALDRIRLTMQAGSEQPHPDAWATSVGELPRDSILVFDDLGPPQAGSAEATLWMQLIEACKRANVRLITTAASAPPRGLLETLSAPDVFPAAVPMFDDAEASELLLVCGASTGFLTKGRISLLRGLAGGHPALLRAVADRLAQHGWQFNGSTLAALLAGSHAQELSVETSRRVFETVTEPHCRELLYRLCLIRDALTLEEIGQAAALSPAQARYLECVQALDGLWLQPAGLGRYEVSPLVLLFGAQQLDTAVANQVHRFAGRRLLGRGEIDPVGFLKALMHLMIAGDHSQVASLMLWALADRRSAAALGPEWPLIFYPPEQPLPPSLLAGLAIAIRGHQVVAARRIDRDASAYWQSLLSLMQGVDEQNRWGVLLATSQVLTAGSSSVPELIEAARQVERIGGRARMPSGEEIASPGWDQGMAIWLVTPAIKQWTDLWMWVELLGMLDAQRQQQVLSSSESVEILQPVIDRLWVAAAEGREAGGTLEEALGQLRRLEGWAVARNADLLTACAIRGQMVIAGEYEKRHSDVETIAQRGLQNVAAVGPAKALIELTYGSQLELIDEHEAAIPHLEEAAREENGQSSLNRVFALLAATEAAFEIGGSTTEYAEAALLVLESEEDTDAALKARVFAEVATSRWSAGRRPEAFDAIETAVATVLGAGPSEAVQSLTVRIGHALGYFAAVAATGSPPQGTSSGETYVAPTPAMFSGHNAAAVTMYRARTGSTMLKAQLSALAIRVGRSERSEAWAENAFAEATAGGVPATACVVASTVLDVQVRSGDAAAAIETAFVAARALRAMNAERQAGRDPMRDEFRVDLRPGPPSTLDDLDETALQFVLVPMVLRICEEITRDAKAGRAAAQTVIDAIARLGRQVLPSDKWESLRSLLERLVNGGDERTVAEEVQRIGQTHQGMVQLGAYLLLSTWPGVDFARSSVLQVHAASFTLQVAAVSAPDTPERFAEFVWSLWHGRLESARFRFRSPSMLTRDLEEAKGLPTPAATIRAVLRSVVRSLGVRLRDSTREWLDQATPDSGVSDRSAH